jgi:hypothetical protein
MGLIYQRTPHQCAIATITMATGREYDEVLEAALASGTYEEGQGCRSYATVLKALGYSDKFENGEPVGDFASRHRGFEISPEFYRSMAWGRRAIMSVPSLNIPNDSHSVYWDGREVFDPNPPEKKRYTGFAELLPTNMVLFREVGGGR